MKRPDTTATAHRIGGRGRTLGLLLAFVIALAAGELLARAVGLAPWQDAPLDPREPTVLEHDPVLGWRAVPGVFTFPAHEPGGQTIRMTNWPGGFRATAPTLEPGDRRILFLGCSFTEGWAISDDETYPWKIQEAFPEFRVLNLATAGYGTYQSLLALDAYYASGGTAELVVYGFLDFHAERNVAGPLWLKTLATAARRKHVWLPYASLDERGALVGHPPVHHPDWPLRTTLALVNQMQTVYARRHFGPAAAQAHDVTTRVIADMKQLAEDHHSRFLVAVLGSPGATEPYETFFRSAGVERARCIEALTPDLIVPGDGHPNGVLTSRWADCIGKALRRRLRATARHD